MFSGMPLRKDSRVHFLLIKEHSRRHLNKCLRGSYILMQTTLKKRYEVLGTRQTILDLLLYWERHCLTPAFNISHLCHVSDIGVERALEKIEIAQEHIYNNVRAGKDNPAISRAPFYRPRNPQNNRQKDGVSRAGGAAGEDDETADGGDHGDAEDDDREDGKVAGTESGEDDDREDGDSAVDGIQKNTGATSPADTKAKGTLRRSTHISKRPVKYDDRIVRVTKKRRVGQTNQAKTRNAADQEQGEEEEQKLKKSEEVSEERLRLVALWKKEAEKRQQELEKLRETQMRQGRALEQEIERRIADEVRKTADKKDQELRQSQDRLSKEKKELEAIIRKTLAKDLEQQVALRQQEMEKKIRVEIGKVSAEKDKALVDRETRHVERNAQLEAELRASKSYNDEMEKLRASAAENEKKLNEQMAVMAKEREKLSSFNALRMRNCF